MKPILTLAAAIAAICSALPVRADADSLLTHLDHVLAERDIYDRAHQEEITEHKRNLANSTTLADQYNSLRGLYGAYRSYKIDSAMIVADMRLRVARQIGEPGKIASATLNLAESYVKAGMPEKGVAILDTLRTEGLEKYHLKYRMGIYRTAYAAIEAQSPLPADRMDAREKLQQFTAEALRESPPGTLGTYTLQAEKLREAGMNAEAVAVLEEAAKKHDFSGDAAMQYTLGEMYLCAGQRDKATECLARSAIIDISGGVKEYRALILLSSLLFEDGDLERAFDYINMAFDDAEFSTSRLRTAEIMRSMPVIDASFHAAERWMNERTRTMLIAASVLVVLLLMSLGFVAMEYVANRRMLALNADIRQKLEAKNEELRAADALKLRHINLLMQAYASHISRLRDFRKAIYRQLKTSQITAALDMAKSDKVEAADIAAFHEMFDDAFLSMYPGFVEQVSRLMTEPVKLKTPGRLTPELRVAAMMRLGMTSTDEIASLMQYSAQTVYNLRSSLKAMLRVPWDDFAAYLAEA